jgi:hypothetical protein
MSQPNRQYVTKAQAERDQAALEAARARLADLQAAQPEPKPEPKSSQDPNRSPFRALNEIKGPTYQAPRSQGSHPLDEAEEALKRLRARPDDKEAAQALERALQRLRERESPRQQKK